MGARVIYNFKQSDGMYVCLYSHWGEDNRHNDLADALDKALPRWNDESYCIRIVVSQLIGDEWDDETGFGLWASKEPCYDETWIEIDLAAQTVIDESGEHSFVTFTAYHKSVAAV